MRNQNAKGKHWKQSLETIEKRKQNAKINPNYGMKGKVTWNKGLTMDEKFYSNYGMRNKKHTELSKKKMSLSRLKYNSNPNNIHPMTGRTNKWGKHKPESIKKMSLSKTKDRIEWKCPQCNKIFYLLASQIKKKKYCSVKCSSNSPKNLERNISFHKKEKIKIKCLECGKIKELLPSELRRNKRFCSRKCAHKNKDLKEKFKEMWKNPEYRKKNLSEENIKKKIEGLMKRPTSFEKKIAELCIEYSLPFIYTGNGQFLINFKNPDFVNEQDKVVIEVFYSWFKTRDYGSVENYKEFCKKRYEPAGWKVIFIDENEVDVDNWKELCLNKIKEIIV